METRVEMGTASQRCWLHTVSVYWGWGQEELPHTRADMLQPRMPLRRHGPASGTDRMKIRKQESGVAGCWEIWKVA